MYFFLLQTASTIPGLPEGYIHPRFAGMVDDLFSKMMPLSWRIAVVISAITLAMALSGILNIWKLTVQQVFMTIIFVVLALSLYQYTFGFMVSIGYDLGEVIIPDQKIGNIWAHAKENVLSDKTALGSIDPTKVSGADTGWLSMLGNLLDASGTGSFWAGTLAMIVGQLTMIIFSVATYAITALWLILCTLLYCLGPIMIALGALPKVGSRLLANYFTMLFEISLWQLWMHICSWLVIASNELIITDTLTPVVAGAAAKPIEASGFDFAQASGMAIVMTCLYIATPMAVKTLFPFSSGTGGMASIITKQLSSAVGAAVAVGATIASAGIGAAAGAAGAAKTAAAAGETASKMDMFKAGAQGAMRGAISSTRMGERMQRMSKSMSADTDRAVKETKEFLGENKPSRGRKSA